MRHTVTWLLATVLALTVAGCTSIPTSGPVIEEPQRRNEEDRPIEIEPRPPRDDMSPREIVSSFLLAMAEASGTYDIARQYLTPDAATTWQPLSRVLIYSDRDSPTVDESSAVLTTTVVGTLNERGSFRRGQDPLEFDFGLTQVDGQWRISNPPPGLLLGRELFEISFAPVTMYFFDPSRSALVPDVIYAPKQRRNPSFLISHVLSGPTPWLAPAVVSAVPAGTRLESVEVSDGLATVRLSEEAASIDEPGKWQVAAQVAAVLDTSLGTIDEIDRVALVIAGVPVVMAGADEDGSLPLDMYEPLLPSHLPVNAELFGVADDRVVNIRDRGPAGVDQLPVLNTLGDAGRNIDDLAVSREAGSFALITDERRRLLLLRRADSEPTEIMRGSQIIGAQFGYEGELWVLTRDGAGTAVRRFIDGRERPVDALELADVSVTSFRLSPDGVRMVIAGTRGEDSIVALMRIKRDTPTLVDGFTPLMLRQGQVGPGVVSAVAWRTGTSIMALGSVGDSQAINPYEFDIDAVHVDLMASVSWEANRLATTPYNEEFAAIALGGEMAWRYVDDTTWVEYTAGLTAVTYPG